MTERRCGLTKTFGGTAFGPCVRPTRHRVALPHTDAEGKSWWFDPDTGMHSEVLLVGDRND